MMKTTVVIHGSALTDPATARDVDVIYVGDRAEAERVARGWSGDNGCGALPLDLHESRYPTVLRNLTPHPVVILHPAAIDGDLSQRGKLVARERTEEHRLVVFASEGVARAAEVGGDPDGEIVVEVAGHLFAAKIPVRRAVRFARTIDLPAPADGVGLIVSQVTADAAAAEGRDCRDLFTPHEVVRDRGGNIVGCVSLRRAVAL